MFYTLLSLFFSKRSKGRSRPCAPRPRGGRGPAARMRIASRFVGPQLFRNQSLSASQRLGVAPAQEGRGEALRSLEVPRGVALPSPLASPGVGPLDGPRLRLDGRTPRPTGAGESGDVRANLPSLLSRGQNTAAEGGLGTPLGRGKGAPVGEGKSSRLVQLQTLVGRAGFR